MIPSKIKIESFAKRCHMGTLGGKGLIDAQTLIKLFRSCVGRPIVTYLEDLPNFDQLTTVKLLLDTVENRYKKIVNVHSERLNS